MNFSLSIENWNIVEEVGLPEDGDWCFLVFGKEDDTWSIGGYSEEENQFYANIYSLFNSFFTLV